MEQEQATMAVSLEEPGLPQPETPPAAPVETPAAQTPPPNPDDLEPEGTIAAATGEKFVPLGAVKAERERRKAAETTLSAKDQEIAALKEKAQRFDEAKDYLDRAKPYIEKAKADLQKQHTPPEPQGPLSEAEAVEYAKDFDLYTPDGKPDVARAQRIAARNEKLSERKAQQAVAPLIQTEAQRQANFIRANLLSRPIDKTGAKVDQAAFDKLWAEVPPEQAIQPGVADIVYLAALGMQYQAGRMPAPALPPVVPTEGVGSGAPKEQALTSMSQRFQQASNMKPHDFKETREKYTPGVPNSLE